MNLTMEILGNEFYIDREIYGKCGTSGLGTRNGGKDITCVLD